MAKDFLKKLNQNVLKESKPKKQRGVSKVISTSQVGERVYSTILHQVIDEQGNKDATLITLDQGGNIVDATNIKAEESVAKGLRGELEKDKKKISIVIKNDKNQTIAKQSITDSLQ